MKYPFHCIGECTGPLSIWIIMYKLYIIIHILRGPVGECKVSVLSLECEQWSNTLHAMVIGSITHSLFASSLTLLFDIINKWVIIMKTVWSTSKQAFSTKFSIYFFGIGYREQQSGGGLSQSKHTCFWLDKAWGNSHRIVNKQRISPDEILRETPHKSNCFLVLCKMFLLLWYST